MRILFQFPKKSKPLKVAVCVFLSLVILIITIVFIPVIINEAYKTETGYYTLWEAKDILAFYSVILSGIITFIALYFTIKHSNEIAKSQTLITMSLIKQPFFVIDSVKHQNSPEKFIKNQFGHWCKSVKIKNKYELNNVDKGLVNLEIKNIGDGIALSTKYNISMFAGETSVQDSVIKSDKVFSVMYSLYDNLNDKYVKESLQSSCKLEKTFSTYINISYQNTLGMEYIQEIEINLLAKDDGHIHVSIKQISPQCINAKELFSK